MFSFPKIFSADYYLAQPVVKFYDSRDKDARDPDCKMPLNLESEMTPMGKACFGLQACMDGCC